MEEKWVKIAPGYWKGPPFPLEFVCARCHKKCHGGGTINGGFTPSDQICWKCDEEMFDQWVTETLGIKKGVYAC